jgi:formate dehydrogenase major subunit
MKTTRRGFLKVSGTVAVAAALDGLGFNPKPVQAAAWKLRVAGTKEMPTICPYCAVGCGIICHTDRQTGKVVYTEGDSDHPINQGTLCSKGAALYQVAINESRITQPLYRAPYSEKWETKSWDWMLTEIAKRVKHTRDQGFTATNIIGQTVNRVTNIAHVGSAALDNEECWVIQAMMRSLGLVYIEHQARI